MLDIFVLVEDLRNIKAIEISPQEVTDMRNVGFDHFTETWYAWLRGNGVLFHKASNCHGTGKGRESNVHQLWRIKTAVEISSFGSKPWVPMMTEESL